MLKSRESMSGMWVSIRVMAFLVALGGGWVVPNRARAEDELQKARTEAGHIWYDKYCTPCHGKGGAPGSAAYPKTKEPVDLRTYVQRHGGKFPAGEWIAIVAGSPQSPVHSEVWEKIRRQHQTSTASGSAEARGIVASIAEYVISVQTK
jgi:mono/diheme cytochrome c family protein